MSREAPGDRGRGRRGDPYATTRKARSAREQIAETGAPGFTVLCHPDPARVGEQAMADGPLSRLDPYFAPPSGGSARPLEDPYLSRRPLIFRADSDGGVDVDPAGSGSRLEIDGTEVTGPLHLDRGRIEQGVTLLVADRVALMLHNPVPPGGWRRPSFGLVGESASMLRVREEILRLSGLDYPVLLRGESGTGKELVARALHDSGPRSKGPFVAVNLAAIPSELAEAELFGAAKGAYSGAEHQRSGHFKEADRGTLFLDEIGDTPAAVQVKLLRALEEGQIQPLGTSKAQRVDVRLISATDVDLGKAIREDRFRQALFQRLAVYPVELPALRERREDVGRLFFHFLRQELGAIREGRGLELLDHRIPGDDPWVPAELVVRLARHRWPGNVRELRNVARQLIVASRGLRQMRIADLERLLERAPAAVAAKPERPETRPGYRHPDEVDEDELIAALRENGWNKRRAAAALKVSRTSLDSLMKKSGRVRRGADLSREEIEEAQRRHGGDLDTAADELEVSKRALILRMRVLGLDPEG
jgi:two-component system nitrogen regulation response regulator GlnG